MKLTEIWLRDPYILAYNNLYYLYGTRPSKIQRGFDVYISSDLENWSTPKEVFKSTEDFWGTKDFWAPEVHYYGGKFYMFASFKAENVRRGTQILVSDEPDGMFIPLSEGAVTPNDWECLDGTFYVENGKPYIIFCHEWTQIKNGEVCAAELSADLKTAISKPFTLWKAGDAKWIKGVFGDENCVTDGPFVYKIDDKLCCIWASFSDEGYSEAISISNNGSIKGRWVISDKLLFKKDGGHAMIFKTLSGEEKLILHSPNEAGKERPIIFDLKSLLHI